MPLQQQITQGATLGGAAATSTVVAILGPSAAAGPIGLAIGGAVLAITALSGKIAHLISGCGETCTYATQVVNEASPIIEQIAATYWQEPIRTKSFQQWTLSQLDGVFNQIRQLCDPAKLGDAGTRCISERLVRGGTAPWCPTPDHRGCDSYTTIYDPIANDPGVQPDPDPVQAALQGIVSATPGGYGTMAIAGLLTLGFVAYRLRTR